MAATKLSGLTALLGTEVAADDLVYIADTSATASKKIELAEFGGKYLLDEITNVTPGEFDFLDIPQQFNRVYILGEVRGDQALTTIPVYCYFNNDRTAANYWSQLTAAGPAASGAEAATPNIGSVSGASSPANAYGTCYVTVDDYAGSNLKGFRSETDADRATGSDIAIYRSSVYHDSMVAAITRLTIAASNSPTNGLIGTLRLYGEF